MDFIAPPMFDILNFQTWKVKMSMYLKALDIHVYLAIIKNLYFAMASILRQMPNDKERDADQENDTSDMCYIVQGDYSLR